MNTSIVDVSKSSPEACGPLDVADLCCCSLQWENTNTWLVHCVVCLFTHQLSLVLNYSFCIPSRDGQA